MATFEVDELAAYPGVSASPESLELVAEIINELVDELLEEYWPAQPVREAKLRALALTAAARSLTNPLGATTMSIQMDDFKETVVLPDGSVVAGSTGIGFTADEMGRLRAAITGVETQRRSIRLPVPGYTDCPDPRLVGWLPS